MANPDTAVPLICRELIGRSAELTELLNNLKLASTGKPQFVLLAGEAGLGKSRLCQALLEESRQFEPFVLAGQASPQGQSLPLGLFIDAFQRFFSAISPQKVAVKPDLQKALAYLLNLLPEFEARFPDVTPIPINTSGTLAQQQYRLFQAVLNGLSELARSNSTPLIFIGEDLHWADETSLELLAFLARQLTGKAPGVTLSDQPPVLIVTTYRNDELANNPALTRLVVQLNSQRQAQEIRLYPLDRTAHNQMVQAILGQPLLEEYSRLLFERDEGNPFYLEELLGAMVAGGQLQQRNGQWHLQSEVVLHLPLSLKASIRERLNRLANADQEVLAYAAVIGREFDFELLATISGLDEARLLAVLRRAINLQLLAELKGDAVGEGEVYHFRHALTREAIYSDMLTRERRVRHRIVAEALEKLPQSTPSRLIAEHYWLANLPEKAKPYALQEAERARQLLAFREERYYLQIALSSIGDTEPERFGILHRLGLLSLAMMDVPAALNWLNQAKSGYQSAGQWRKAAQVLVHLTFLFWFFDPPNLPGLVEELEQAALATYQTLDLNSAMLDEEALAIFSQTAFSLASADKHQRAKVWIERCFNWVEKWADPTKLQAMQLSFFARGVVKTDGTAQEAVTGLADLRQGIDFALKNSLPDLVMAGYGVLLQALINLGQTQATVQFIEELEDYERRSGSPRMSNLKGWHRFYYGEWDLAITDLEQDLQKPNSPTVMSLYRVALAHFYLARNDLDEAQALLEPSLTKLEPLEFAYFAPALWGQAKLCAEREQFSLATIHFRKLRQLWKTIDDTGWIVPVLLDGVKFFSTAGQLWESNQWLQDLKLLTNVTNNPIAKAALLEAEAWQVLAEGAKTQAIEMFERVVTTWAELNRPYYQAQACQKLAYLLLSQPKLEKAAREKIEKLLNEAKAEYSRLKIQTKLDEVEKCLHDSRLLAQTKRRATIELERKPFQGLTRREVQVLVQLCGGLSNREIAAVLNISEGTVEVHINHILAKLDCENRLQAATYAIEQGWFKK